MWGSGGGVCPEARYLGNGRTKNVGGLREEERADVKGYVYKGSGKSCSERRGKGEIPEAIRNLTFTPICDYPRHRHLSNHTNQASRSFIPTFESAC